MRLIMNINDYNIQSQSYSSIPLNIYFRFYYSPTIAPEISREYSSDNILIKYSF